MVRTIASLRGTARPEDRVWKLGESYVCTSDMPKLIRRARKAGLCVSRREIEKMSAAQRAELRKAYEKLMH